MRLLAGFVGVASSMLIGRVMLQSIGDMKENINLPLQLEECTGIEDCTKINTKVTMDQNWRWVHQKNSTDNCYTGNVWDDEVCPDPETCNQNCCVDGIDEADWNGTYGVRSDGFEATLTFVTEGEYSINVGQRLFLLDESEEEYQIFYMKNREFTMDVDVSQIGCGLNGAVYFVEMDHDGGKSKYPANEAGAAYGTGYCDAQCPHDLKFISGEPNVIDWQGSEVDGNAGKGHYGSCCVEVDIWEANSINNAFTLHPCFTEGAVRCEGVDCGDNVNADGESDRYKGICDKDGCDFHNWRFWNKSYYGPSDEFAVDTSRPFTIVTQFPTVDGTDTGDILEMRRVYVQDGKVIPNAFSNLPGMDLTDSVNDHMCDQAKEIFGDFPDYQNKGAMHSFNSAFENGLVLVLSLWGDYEAHMLWLDSTFPTDGDASQPGIERGPCAIETGNPDDLIVDVPDAYVKFSKLRFGPIGSTYPSGGDQPTTNNGETTTTAHNHETTTDGPRPDTTTTTNSDCPGGSLDHCIALCPSEPIEIHNNCIKECAILC